MRLAPLAVSAMLASPFIATGAELPTPRSARATDAAAPPDKVWTAALRYRLEQVDQDGFADTALASTARLRVGVKQRLARGLQGFVEGEAVWAMNDRFNSGANGRTQYPGVADATAVEVSQAGLSWQGERGDVIVGRQRLLFDNQRFIGNSGWRQNEQTFDAALIAFRPDARWTLHYGYVDRVHRVASDHARDPLARERDLSAHLLHGGANTRLGAVSAYHYAVEDRDVATASSRTTGLRWTPTRTAGDWRWAGTVEFARQSDHADNPLRFSHAYHLFEASAGRGAITAKLGHEHLAGNGTHALQTPLATLHAFNGWADVFPVTPANGLEDRYATLTATTAWSGPAPLEWTLTAHDYQSTHRDLDYGHEWNASLGTKLGHSWTAILKFADYRSDAFARDTRKVWVGAEWGM